MTYFLSPNKLRIGGILPLPHFWIAYLQKLVSHYDVNCQMVFNQVLRQNRWILQPFVCVIDEA